MKTYTVNETATIILPLPPRVLSPNCPPGTRGGRFARVSASKRYRQLAVDATVALGLGSPWQKCTVKAFFYHKTERRRDDVNHLAMLKAAYDGCVEGGLVLDDDSRHLTTLPCEFRMDKKNPRVELLFTRIK
jgi:hypothetical protein